MPYSKRVEEIRFVLINFWIVNSVIIGKSKKKKIKVKAEEGGTTGSKPRPKKTSSDSGQTAFSQTMDVNIASPDIISPNQARKKSRAKESPQGKSGRSKSVGAAANDAQKPLAGPRRKSMLKNMVIVVPPEDDDSDGEGTNRTPSIPKTRAPPNFLASADPNQKATRKSRASIAASNSQRFNVGRTPITLADAQEAPQEDYLDFTFSDDEIERLTRRFMVLDQDNSGTLDIAEFMAIPELQQNSLAERIIRLFDKDKNGVVDFKEFIDGVSVFSTKSDKESKMKFAFRVYDMDNDGYISNVDLFEVLTMMVGDTIKDVHLQEIVNRTMLSADKDEDGRISYPEFYDYIESNSLSTASYSKMHVEI